MKNRIALLALFLVIPIFAFSQGFGRIVGTVTDPSGAVMVGANVTATEVGTGQSRSTTTNAEGYYALSSLPPAQYSLAVTAQGFRTYQEKALTLLADQTLTSNARLVVGTANEVVEIKENALQVDTATSTLRQVVEWTRLHEMPLNGLT